MLKLMLPGKLSWKKSGRTTWIPAWHLIWALSFQDGWIQQEASFLCMQVPRVVALDGLHNEGKGQAQGR